MVEIFIPSYLDSFKQLLDNIQSLKKNGLQETSGREESLAGLVATADSQLGQVQPASPTVATHYYNPDDERSLQGVGADQGKIEELYTRKAEGEQGEPEKEVQVGAGDVKKNAFIEFHFMDEADIKVEPECEVDSGIEVVFGRKVALAMHAVDWKYKETALKVVYKFTEKYLDGQKQNEEQPEITLADLTRACATAIGLTCKEKVIKVFSISLQLLNLLIGSTKLEKSGGGSVLKNAIVEKNIVLKLLQKSEEGNTRMTNKIHEALLDMSFNPDVGEAITSAFIL